MQRSCNTFTEAFASRFVFIITIITIKEVDDCDEDKCLKEYYINE